MLNQKEAEKQIGEERFWRGKAVKEESRKKGDYRSCIKRIGKELKISIEAEKSESR